MIIFFLTQYEYLVPDKSDIGKYSVKKFRNGTKIISVETSPENEKCVIIGGSMSDEEIIETALLCHTLKKDGAKEIGLFLPFIPYSRQDKDIPGESLGMKWLADILSVSGADNIMTIDIHSKEAINLSPIPITSISPAETIAEEIKKGIGNKFICVAPDEGAVDNCRDVSNALGSSTSIACFLKKRTDYDKVEISGIEGSLADEALVVDDILDTGGTLLKACEYLKKSGVKRIIIAVSHGVFDGDKWKELFNLGVERIYCTDTNRSVKQIRHPKITIIPIKNLVARHLVDI